MGRRSESGGIIGRLVSILLLLAAAGGVGFLAWKWKTRPPEKLPEIENPLVNVEVEVVNPEREVADTFQVQAVVEPNRVVEVSAEVAGRIEKIELEEGVSCQAGQVILRLDTDLLRAEYERAAAQAEYDAKEYQRILSLHEGGAATAQQKDRAETQMAVTQAQLQAARTRLERATIAAPIAGVLNRIVVEQGEYVQPGTPVAEIVDIRTAKVVVPVPERDIQFFSGGETATIFADARGTERELEGAITYISELADTSTRSTRVEIAVENARGALRSGQIVRVRLTRRILRDVVMIPLAAVIPLENGKAVYVVQSDEAERRDVELGLIKGRRVQITKGLGPGDRLVVAGHRFVAPGQKVKVVKEHGKDQNAPD